MEAKIASQDEIAVEGFGQNIPNQTLSLLAHGWMMKLQTSTNKQSYFIVQIGKCTWLFTFIDYKFLS